MKEVCGIKIVNSDEKTPEEIADSVCKAIQAAAITSEQLIKGLSVMNEMLKKCGSEE